MRQVQNFADGLTSVLQLKGQEPLMFPPELRGVVDMLPFFCAARRRVTRLTGSPINSLASFDIEVPVGQVWVIQHVVFSVIVRNTNDVFQGTVRYNPVTGPTSTLCRSPAPQANPGTTGRFPRQDETFTAQYVATTPFVALPGDLFTANVNLFVKAGPTDPITEFEIVHAAFEA